MNIDFNGMWSAINEGLEWIMWIAYLNLLWIVFTLAGLVVFGWMPSTIALYATWRKLLKKREETVPIFKTFIQEYKQGFIKKNGAGAILILLGLVLYGYFLLYQQGTGLLSLVAVVFVFFFSFFYVNLLIYLPPVMVHFDLKFFQYFKQALLISMNSFKMNVSIYILIVLVGCMYYFLPAVILPFGFSLLSLLILKGCLLRFSQLGF